MRFRRIARWLVPGFFAWQTVGSLIAAIFSAAQSDFGSALIGVIVGAACGAVAWWLWPADGSPGAAT